jgi:prophage tail gpP-like protein
MSARVPNVFQKTKLIDDAVTLFIGGQIYEGFKSATITREMNSLGSTFSLSIVDRWRADQESFSLKPGLMAHIHAGKNTVVDGYIDSVSFDLQGQNRNITISGRSRTADLIDSSITGKNEYKNLDIKAIADKLVEPFSNVRVLLRAAAGAKFDKFTVRQGETVFEALDRLARQRSLVMFPSYEGNVILTKKDTTVASTEIRSGVNLLGGSATYDNSERFSKYIVKGQAQGDKGTEEQAIGAKGEATDAGIGRNRELLVIAENVVDTNGAVERAKYEADIRAARSVEITLTVLGWRQDNGEFWDVNQLVFIDAGFLGYRGQGLIKRVQYIKEEGGTKAELTVIRPDAFEFNKEFSKEKDPVDQMGWDKV